MPSAFGPEETSSCMDWLNTQSPTSVIYVSFGTLATVIASALEEILLGIEAPNVPFLVVMTPDAYYPEGVSKADEGQTVDCVLGVATEGSESPGDRGVPNSFVN